MAELKTPVKLVEYEPNDAPRRKAYALVDAGGAWLCTFHRVQREGAEAIKDAVNRDAEHEVYVAELKAQRDATLSAWRVALEKIESLEETVNGLTAQRDALLAACKDASDALYAGLARCVRCGGTRTQQFGGAGAEPCEDCKAAIAACNAARSALAAAEGGGT